MRRRSLALPGPLVLAACGPSDEQIAGAVLLFAPLVYLLAMMIVSWLHAIWKRIVPALNFGKNSHNTALALLAGPAIYGAFYTDVGLIGAALVVFGSCVLGLWLLLARLTARSGWGFRWGGLVATGLFAAPMLLGLLWREHLYDITVPMMRVYLYGGGLGTVPVVLLTVLMIEGALALRSARAVGSDEAR
jgi:hypothetical protein